MNATYDSGGLVVDPPPTQVQSGRDLLGSARLLTMAYENRDLGSVRTTLVARAARDPRDAAAWLDLSTILYIHRLPELAYATQRQALEIQPVFRLRRIGEKPGLRLLAIMTAGDLSSNMPLEFLVEGSDVQLELLYLGSKIETPRELPAHDVAIVAIAESVRSRELLLALEAVIDAWPRRILNRPKLIAALSRDRVAATLAGVRGAYVPPAVRLTRAELLAVSNLQDRGLPLLPGGTLPVIARPVDSHGGHGLARLETFGDIARFLAGRPDDEFYVTTFVDCRGHDGHYRKYRIALIGGIPYACHMAISESWVVHYLSAGMDRSAAKRAEEARFFAHFDDDFAHRHGPALREVHDRLGLDYVVIDCAELPDGRLLLWEADTCGVVHAMDPVDVFPYKRPQMRKVYAAFRNLLERKAHEG